MATDWQCQIIRAVLSPAENPRLGNSETLLLNRLDAIRSCINQGYRQGRCTGEEYGPRITQIGWVQRKWRRIEDRFYRVNVGRALFLSNWQGRRFRAVMEVLGMLPYLLLTIFQCCCTYSFPAPDCFYWLCNAVLLLWRDLLRLN